MGYSVVNIISKAIAKQEKISNNRRVFLLDLRNHRSSSHSYNMDYDFMAEDVLKMITELRINKPILCGHSLGGKSRYGHCFKGT
eukprot:UN02616